MSIIVFLPLIHFFLFLPLLITIKKSKITIFFFQKGDNNYLPFQETNESNVIQGSWVLSSRFFSWVYPSRQDTSEPQPSTGETQRRHE